MKKFLIGLGAIVVIVVGYWLISPLFIESRVDETLEDIMLSNGVVEIETETGEAVEISELEEIAPVVLKRGEFVGLAGHSGEGTATLLEVNGKFYVRFEDDFKVTNGPDLFVYFGRDGKYVSESRFSALKGNVGGQNYEVPAGIDPLEYDEVWIWCRAFSTPFAKAELN